VGCCWLLLLPTHGCVLTQRREGQDRERVPTCALLKVEGTCVGSGACCCWHSAHHSLLLVTATPNLVSRARQRVLEQFGRW
jgi:hypothetical protein